jgi:hypothetical protein
MGTRMGQVAHAVVGGHDRKWPTKLVEKFGIRVAELAKENLDYLMDLS